jgi:hypothetical protein
MKKVRSDDIKLYIWHKYCLKFNGDNNVCFNKDALLCILMLLVMSFCNLRLLWLQCHPRVGGDPGFKHFLDSRLRGDDRKGRE